VVVVHDSPEFNDRVTEALRDAGHDVASFADPILALDAIEAGRAIEVLVTRIGFPKGRPNGISLAQMVSYKRPGVRILFTARAKFERHARGWGEFMASPINVPDVVDAVGRLLRT
jgi:DNA-binding NtrC family response regulator